MVCFRVYSSPVCGKAGETKGDGAAAVNSRCHCRRSSRRTVTCTSPPISYNCFRSITRSFIEPNSRFGSEYSWCFPCTCFCNQITAVAPENNFRDSYFTGYCNRTQSKQKIPALHRCREYRQKDSAPIVGYTPSGYPPNGCRNRHPLPGVWPARSSYCICPTIRIPTSTTRPIRSGHKTGCGLP